MKYELMTLFQKFFSKTLNKFIHLRRNINAWTKINKDLIYTKITSQINVILTKNFNDFFFMDFEYQFQEVVIFNFFQQLYVCVKTIALVCVYNSTL